MVDRFDIWMKWLRELGGTYEYLRDYDPPNPKRANYEPKFKPTFKPLRPWLYRVDEHGSIRKINNN